jgi:hypothetical protein
MTNDWQTLDDLGSVALISLRAGFGLSSLGQGTSPVTVAAVLCQAIPGFGGKEVRMIIGRVCAWCGIATAPSSSIGIRLCA